MEIITIPKKMFQKGELVILPRSDYEEFLDWRKTIKTYKPTSFEKKILRKARKDFTSGNHISLRELKNELGSARS